MECASPPLVQGPRLLHGDHSLPDAAVSTDRPSRFTDGSYGVLYVGGRFDTALFETIHQHARFMARTREAPGWTSQFRGLIMAIDADFHDLRSTAGEPVPVLDSYSYAASQALVRALRGVGSDGIAYPSIRHPGGQCVVRFCPDRASNPIQGRHLDYHWDGERVNLVRDAGSGAIFRAVDLSSLG
jgi:hypothetical protein